MIFLQNEYIKASFSSKGAELQSLNTRQNHAGYLWNGDAAYWGKFSPVLFPIVGSLKQNIYYFGDKQYQLPRHGFARDKDFNAHQLNETEVLFTLQHSEETLKVYPFRFTLQLHYKLSGSTLSCVYTVSNPAEAPLLFSIGAHPAFATPTNDGLQYSDYFLQFNKDSELTYHKIKHDLIDNETVNIPLKNGQLPLKHELFYEDALVFKYLKSDCISLRNHKNTHGIHFRFQNFPFFGIWAAKNADFICLEPWQGIADGIDHDQNLQHKEGMISLASNKSWTGNWEVECF